MTNLKLFKEKILQTQKSNDIQKALYETYKAYWMRNHISKLLEMLSHYQKEKENEQLTERYEEALLELNNSIELKKFFAIIEYAMDNKILFHEIIKYLLEGDIYGIVSYEVDLIKEDGKLILQVYNNNGAKIYICYENNDLVITATEDKKSDVISLLEGFSDVMSDFFR